MLITREIYLCERPSECERVVVIKVCQKKINL